MYVLLQKHNSIYFYDEMYNNFLIPALLSLVLRSAKSFTSRKILFFIV